MPHPARNIIELKYHTIEQLVHDIEAIKKVAELTQQGVEIRIKVKTK